MILNNLLWFVEIHKLHAVSLKFGSFFNLCDLIHRMAVPFPNQISRFNEQNS